LSFFKSDKCKICKKNLGHRFCFRTGKDICWQDCNEMRIDRKCPSECSYALKETDDLSLKTKADSIAEYTDLLKKQIDKWISLPQKIFGDEIPRNMAESESGQQRLIEFFQQFQINSLIPLSYLKDKLSLHDLKVASHIKSYEDITIEFLEMIIKQEWKQTIDLLNNPERYDNEEFKKNYLLRLQSNKILVKLTDFFLVSSALSQDKKKSLVYFQLNGKYNITISLKRKNDNWLISEKIFGKPEIVNSEGQAMQQIAVLLSKNKLSDCFELLKKYSSIYVDSSDLNYYWGMYYMISNNEDKAFNFIQTAVELDPEFLEAKGIYATMLTQRKKIDSAKLIFEEIIKKNPKDIKSMNNLASIYISEKRKDEAKKLLEKCLIIDPNFEYAKKNLEKL